MVDRLQGREKGIVILVTVRSNMHGKIDPLDDDRRLNLAITRAKEVFWIVGDTSTLSKGSSKAWKELIQDCRERGFLRGGGEQIKGLPPAASLKIQKDKIAKIVKKRPATNLNRYFEGAIWKVSVTERAKSSLQKLEESLMRQVLSFLGLIAKGAGWGKPREDWGQKALEANKDHWWNDLVLRRRFGKYEVVISVDIGRVDLCQCLRVWEVKDQHVSISEQLHKEIIHYYFRRYDLPYLRACLERVFEVKETASHHSTICRPKVFKESARDDIFRKLQEEEGGDKNTVANNDVMLTSYELTNVRVNQLVMASQGSTQKLEWLFDLSPKEKSIIDHKKSAFVLGRSGVGKTTVMLVKMIEIERPLHLAMSNKEDSGLKPIKQVLITASPKLCMALRAYYDRLLSCFDNKIDIREEPLNDAVSGEESLLVSAHDQAALLKSKLPKSWTELKQDNFPLFITYNTLLDLLDCSLGPRSFFKARGGEEGSNNGKMVTFEIFERDFWASFNSTRRSHFQALPVYREIMTYIKGSYAAMNSKGGRLSKEDYCKMGSVRAFATKFDKDKRHQLYELFLHYEEIKKTKGLWDMGDYLSHVFENLKGAADLRPMIDRIYVDEVQDLMEAQIGLLAKHVCKDHQNGYLLAGDSAQTIAREVGFRFENIKDLFFREFIKRKEGEEMPETFKLVENYRTHNGILGVANVIVSLLMHFFEYEIDKLDPEMSLSRGPRPVYIEDPYEAFFNILSGHGERRSLGANQAVIVREEKARQDLRQKNGFWGNSQVVTILESKGLEFDDVVIYNFFTDSSLKDSGWRTIPQYTNKVLNIDCKFHEFDPQEHKLLCWELKQLYVAVTRARKRLWLFDEDKKRPKPLMELLEHQRLIYSQRVGELGECGLAVESSTEEWDKQGHEYFEQGLLDLAAGCFRNSGNDRALAQIHASLTMKTAERYEQSQKWVEAASYYKKAGHEFKEIKDTHKYKDCFTKLASCLKNGTHYKEAAKFFEAVENYAEAGTCYKDGNLLKEAFDAFCKGSFYENALNLAENEGLNRYPANADFLDHAFDLLCKRFDVSVEKEQFAKERERVLKIALKIWEKGAPNMTKSKADGKTNKYMAKTLEYLEKADPSKDAQRKFMAEKKLYAELYEIECKCKNFERAGDVAELWGKRNKAAKSYMDAQALEKAAILVTEGERVYLKQLFISHCISDGFLLESSKWTRSPVLSEETRQKLMKLIRSSGDLALQRWLEELENLSKLLGYKDLVEAGFTLVFYQIKPGKEVVAATQTLRCAPDEVSEGWQKDLREYIKELSDSIKVCDGKTMPSDIWNVFGFFEVRDVRNADSDIPFKVSLHDVSLIQNGVHGESLDIEYMKWETFKTKSLQIFSRMQAGLLSSRISFLNGVVLKKLDTVQKTFKLGTVTSLQRLDLVAYTDRQLLAASLLNIQTQMMELCDDYQNYATNSEEGRQMLEKEIAMFDDYLKDGNRFLWTMQRKKFVLENVVKLTRFCTKKRNMIFYDTFGIPYKVGESPSQTPLEKKVQILLQAFHHMRKEDLIARFSYVCRSLDFEVTWTGTELALSIGDALSIVEKVASVLIFCRSRCGHNDHLMLPESYIMDYIVGNSAASSQSLLGISHSGAPDDSIGSFLDFCDDYLDYLLKALANLWTKAAHSEEANGINKAVTLARAYLLMLILISHHTAPEDVTILLACYSEFFTRRISPEVTIFYYISGNEELCQYRPLNDILWYLRCGMFLREPFVVVKRDKLGQLCATLGDPLVVLASTTSNNGATHLTEDIRIIRLEDDEWTSTAIMQKLQDKKN